MLGGLSMERIALQKLTDWNSSKRKKPLIVWGARQVGKTYLVLELFAKKKMKSVNSVLKLPTLKKSLNIFHYAKENKYPKKHY